MEVREPDCLSEALALAARGWPVFPLHHAIDGVCSCGNANCTSIGKHPRTKNGLKNALTEENRIMSWFRKWPSANIGTVTGASAGTVVIDIDPRHGGNESLSTLEEEHGPLPKSVESCTGGGGRHLIFAHPGGTIRNRSNVRPGIDVRGDGGYIVAPPSTHASGNCYQWRPSHGPNDVPPAAVPSWLLTLIQEPVIRAPMAPSQSASVDPPDDRYARCLQALLKIRTRDQSDGSKRLYAGACRCVEYDLSDVEAQECIRAWERAQAFPRPWSDDEVLVRVRDAEKRVQRGKLLQTKGTIQPASTPGGIPYKATEDGILWLKDTKDGMVAVPLTNFSARIVGEVLYDDGVEQRFLFEMEAKRKGRQHAFSEPAARFATMNWVTEQLGGSAILYPGQGSKDHARCAVQMLSGDIPRRTVYAHLGWREIDGQSVYLHGAGAIAPRTPVVATVELPGSLRHYALPAPPDRQELQKAVQASLSILDLAPDVVMVPVWLAVWRSVLAAADFSIWLCGQTGSGKSEVAALSQQHFGPALDARHLPANWSSTGNSLEALAFAAKDALLVVDDFAPDGTSADIARYHRDADRLLRAQGNQAGRSRLTADAQLRPTKFPRGLILSTGEDVPRGHSIRARALIVEMPPAGMDWQQLSVCQQDASQGVYAEALAGFLQWVARDRDRILGERNQRIASLRERAQQHVPHKRTPGIIAELAWSAGLFTRFAMEIGLFPSDESAARPLFDRCWTALMKAAESQAEHHAAADPVRRFQDLLVSAVASGKAHVATTLGTVPESGGAWGWREHITGARAEDVQWQPQGDRIGWVDGSELLLNADAAYRVAQQAASSDGLAIQSRTLWKRMHERDLLMQTDKPHLKIQRTVEGTRRRVLCVAAEYLAPEVGKLVQSGHWPEGAEENDHGCPTSLPQFSVDWEFSGAENWCNGPVNTPENAPVGQLHQSPHSW